MNEIDEKDCTLLLEEHNIKPTSNRTIILRALAKLRHPVSLKQLEDEILTIDKSGIFRTLTLFHEHHLVHAIEGGEGQMLYELCHSQQHDDDDDEHVHFFCRRCHRTYCLFDAPVPDIHLPQGFVRQSINFVVKGLCSECARKSIVSTT